MKTNISMSKYEKLKNAGVSLVEMLVVFAILSMLVVLGLGSWSILKNADVSKASKNIVSYYEKLRTCTMSKTGEWRLEISKSSDDMYYGTIYCHNADTGADVADGEPVELGKYIDIYYKDEKDVSRTKITSDNPLTIKLKASTGGVSEIKVGESVKYSSGDTSAYGNIDIVLNDSDAKTLKLYYITGKVVKD